MDNIRHDHTEDTRRPSTRDEAVNAVMAVLAAVVLLAAILAFALVTS